MNTIIKLKRKSLNNLVDNFFVENFERRCNFLNYEDNGLLHDVERKLSINNNSKRTLTENWCETQSFDDVINDVIEENIKDFENDDWDEPKRPKIRILEVKNLKECEKFDLSILFPKKEKPKYIQTKITSMYKPLIKIQASNCSNKNNSVKQKMTKQRKLTDIFSKKRAINI